MPFISVYFTVNLIDGPLLTGIAFLWQRSVTRPVARGTAVTALHSVGFDILLMFIKWFFSTCLLS